MNEYIRISLNIIILTFFSSYVLFYPRSLAHRVCGTWFPGSVNARLILIAWVLAKSVIGWPFSQSLFYRLSHRQDRL